MAISRKTKPQPCPKPQLCSKCGAPMQLTVIVPSDKPRYQERLFECATCRHSETVFVKRK